MDSAVAERLRLYADRYETVSFLEGDPSWWMHQVTGAENQEAMAFVASCLSYGSRKQFMPKIGQLLDWSGGEIHEWIQSGAYSSLFSPDDQACFYRLYTYGRMYHFLKAYQGLLNDYGTMGNYLQTRAHSGIEAVESICDYFCKCGVSVVVPKDTQSACKRVCMFLRWMVRSNSPVDLGLWNFIDRRSLIIPLDTHVLSQAHELGLLGVYTASMSAARHLTKTLLEVFPDDPLKGDFALFGYGVNQ